VSARRQVRVAPSSFDRLDELLPAERSPTGVPSTADFLLHEIPPLIDLLALDYEAATLAVKDVPEVRVLIAAGVLVARLALYVVLAADDAVEIIYLEIDNERYRHPHGLSVIRPRTTNDLVGAIAPVRRDCSHHVVDGHFRTGR